MSLKIGINENVLIESATKTEEGVLVINFRQLGDTVEDTSQLKAELEHNPFADWEDGGEAFVENHGNLLSIRLFPFDADPTMNEPDKLPDTLEMRKRVDTIRTPLTHLLLGYMTRENNPLKPAVIFRGTGIDVNVARFGELIMSEEVIAKVYANIIDAFIEAITPFAGKEEYLFRAKFPRQSKKKAFATLPSKFVNAENPFWEPMEIPAEASKIKWTSYEVKHGLNSDAPYATIEGADANNTISDTSATAEPQNDPFAMR